MLSSLFGSKTKKKTLREQFAFLEDEQTNAELKRIFSNLNDCKSDDLNFIAAEILKKMGYQVQIIDGKNDNGIDLLFFEDQTLVGGVQCKAWNINKTTSQVSAPDVNKFIGSLTQQKLTQGIFITTHYFTERAIEDLVDKDNIILIDRKALYKLIMQYFPTVLSKLQYENSLQNLVSCTSCGSGKLIKLFGKSNKKYYYLCENCKKPNFKIPTQ